MYNRKNKEIRHLELFAGIGGFRLALELLGKDFGIDMNCVGFSEIDSYATKSYKANFDTCNDLEIGDIVSFTENKENIRKLEDFSLLTGGFPCQAFSMMGYQKGFEDLRGNVFFKIIDILKEKQPQIILLENVRNLISHNKGETFKTILSLIKESGYPYVYYDIFNTHNFGLAQTRNRVFIFASKDPLPEGFEFSQEVVRNAFNKVISRVSLQKQNNVLDVLEKSVEDKYYLSEILKPTILSNGTKNFSSKSEINPIIAKPLTATMVKMHRACQDNYFSDDFISAKDPIKYKEKVFTMDELLQKRIRKITPQEALNFQGFPKSYYKNAQKVGISNHQLYKQAGNAVSVNTVYAILYYLLIEKDVLKGKNNEKFFQTA